MPARSSSRGTIPDGEGSDVLADALLGRALTFSGVAERAQESVRPASTTRGPSPPAVPDRRRADRRPVVHGSPDVRRRPGAAEHLRRGAAGSDLLRLPVSRVQLRWAEGTLVQWYGDDLERAEALYDHAFDLHQRTELYESNVHDLAVFTLRWDQERLADLTVTDREEPRTRRLDASGRRDRATTGGSGRPCSRPNCRGRSRPPGSASGGSPCWPTRSPISVPAPRRPACSARLDRYSGFLANIGQVGVVGTVDLALARLQWLAGNAEAAERHLAAAEALAGREGGSNELRRCRRVREQWQAAAPGRARCASEQPRPPGGPSGGRRAAALLDASSGSVAVPDH